MGVYYITIISTFCTALLSQVVGKKTQNNIEKNKQKRNNNLLFVFLTATILICVAGLRYRTGTDYWQYDLNYSNYVKEWWNALIHYDEPGIKIVAKVSSFIYNDSSTMFFLVSAITVGLSVKTISKYSNMFAFSVLLYILMGNWVGSFNGVRQFLAGAIIFAGHRFIVERKLFKYILVVLAAGAFHISALVFIFLYFVPLKKINLIKLLALFGGSILLLLSYDYIFSFIGILKDEVIDVENLSAYAARSVNFLRIVVAFAPLLLYFILTKKSKIKKEEWFYVNMLFVNAALMFAASQSAYLARVGIYTNIFLTLSLPKLLYFKDKKLSLLIKFLITSFYFIYWYIEVSGSENLKSYNWIFDR